MNWPRLVQIPLREIECRDRLVSAVTPYILEFSEVATLAQDLLDTCRRFIDPTLTALGSRIRESNSDTYPLLRDGVEAGRFHVVYDIDETRLAIELPGEGATKFYRLLREQRIIRPDLAQIQQLMSGDFSETLAAILWQVGAIKVSLGDLRPLFKVDGNRNRSPIYIDVKGLSNYPEVSDFVISAAALLVHNIDFDLVCGIEAGSISIAALLAQKLARPMFFIRRELRHPEASMFEGIRPHQLFRRKVLLVDDTLVHGWTKTRAIKEVRNHGARVDACFVVFDRQQGGETDLEHMGVHLYSLTNRTAALSPKVPREISLLTDREYAELVEYFQDPGSWHERRGLKFHRFAPQDFDASA
ncbi:MAG: phosphoribosyltransferase family protein [candidate division WOR-3 bacterium]